MNFISSSFATLTPGDKFFINLFTINLLTLTLNLDKTSTEDDYVNDDHQKERQSVNSDKDQVAEFAYYLVEPQQAEFILDGTKGFFASGFGLSRVEQADKSRSGSVPSSVILMAQQRQQQHIRRTTTMRPVHYQIPRPQALIEPDRRFGFEEF